MLKPSDRLSLHQIIACIILLNMCYQSLFCVSCLTNLTFHLYFESICLFNRRIACSRSPGMPQRDCITSTWWLRITSLCPSGSSQMLLSPPWAPSLCTSRWPVRPSEKYDHGSNSVLFLAPHRWMFGRGQFALYLGQRWEIKSTELITSIYLWLVFLYLKDF